MKQPTKDEIVQLDRELESLLESAIPVKARVAKNPSHVFSIRLSSKDLREFSRAASERNMTLSDFMRSATRAAIQGDVDLDKAKAVGEIKEKVRELTEAIDRLTA